MTFDRQLFLQNLRDLDLEAGKTYIRDQLADLHDYKTVGEIIAEEALNQLYINPATSLKIAELLIFFGETVQHTSSHALGLKAKGDVLRAFGMHQAAMDCLDAAGEEFLSIGEEGNWARSRITWIVACAWLGRVDEALQEAVRAHKAFIHLDEYYWACVIDNNTAVIYEQIGQFQNALQLYERMLTTYPLLQGQNELTVKRAIAMAKDNYAIVLTRMGKFELAYRLDKEAYDIFSMLHETSLLVNTEINLAQFDYIQGYYGSALRRYYQALDMLTQNHIDDPMLSGTLNLWLAHCLVKLNRVQEAIQIAGKAFEIYKAMGASLSTGNALGEYALTLVAVDKLSEAITALDEALRIFEQGGFDHHAFAVRLQQAEILLKKGMITKAYDQAWQVKQYFDTHGLPARSVQASIIMADALLENTSMQDASQESYRASLQEAHALCKQITFQARQHNLQAEIYKVNHLLGRLFVVQSDIPKATRYYKASITQVERMLDNLAYDLSPAFLHTAWAVYEDIITLCLQQGHYEQALEYLEQARSTALRQYLISAKSSVQNTAKTYSSNTNVANRATTLHIQQELKEWQEWYHHYSGLLDQADMTPTLDRGVLQQELQRCETKINELFERLHLQQVGTPLQKQKRRSKSNTAHFDLAQLHQQLTSRQVMLAYFLHKEKLVIFMITQDQLFVREVSDGTKQLAYLLPVFHARIQSTMQQEVKRQAIVRNVARASIAEQNRTSQSVGNQGVINQAPTKIMQRLLQKLYALLIAPVESLLPPTTDLLTIVPYGPLHQLPFHALYDGSQYLIEKFQINYLPSSNILISLQNRPTNSENIIGQPLILGYSGKGQLQHTLEEARAVAKLLDGNCYLEHEATIARLIERAADCPVIHIATHGQNRLDAPNFSSVLLADGQFNAIDAFQLHLQNCELVTLSGCETGLALSSGGDEQLGLGRAFLAAGARSLLMSLWPVEDHSTSELMQRFYQQLLHGNTKVQALRIAQCSLLHDETSQYVHPYFWASFRLVGNDGALRYRNNAN